MPPFPKNLVVLLLLASIGTGGYCGRSTGLTFYYRAKYYSGRVPPGVRVGAAKQITQNNPFFDRRYAVLIDMNLASSDGSRLRVYNLQTQKVVFSTRVMHGKMSGDRWATRFSNGLGSNKTALGRYAVVDRYNGKFGRAYRLAGLDGSNFHALARSLVLHASEYVYPTRIGRSEGCPAVSRAALGAMEPYLRPGTLVWVYRGSLGAPTDPKSRRE